MMTSTRAPRGTRSLRLRALPSARAPSHGLGPAFERSPAPQIAVHPRDGTLRAINARARALLEISEQAEVELRADRFWVEPAAFFRMLETVEHHGEYSLLEAELQTLGGRHFWARVDATRVEELILVGLLDVGRYKRETETLRGLAERDSLTGLPNRRAYEENARVAVSRARSEGTPLSLAILDVDHFKRINDRLGHSEGDRVLAQIAERAQANLRRSDFIARFGGEEFVILMPDTHLDEAVAVLERLRAGLDMDTTVSIGVAELRAPDDAGSLLERADRALYRAKESGRDRVAAAPH